MLQVVLPVKPALSSKENSQILFPLFVTAKASEQSVLRGTADGRQVFMSSWRCLAQEKIGLGGMIQWDEFETALGKIRETVNKVAESAQQSALLLCS